ncbi:hypothetical protein [Chondromyces apiculatus]|uniref:Uncharacterized protein n=1 Tax=Chondromyces apiculatus DSM 436 TaxID=1192034 RepID=A0A017T543_9BACT|nr:hypothetical protein [Chondromyces apiculatus]EYF04097.1 Hypothetical protein CAP_4780 [Chondromyces apiculatus DSM 436]
MSTAVHGSGGAGGSREPRAPGAAGQALGDFPLDEVRDLLGVVRAVYAAARERGAGRGELARISKVGQELGRALDLAEASRRDRAAGEAAKCCLEEALASAAGLVDPLTPAAPIVQAARQRVAAPRVSVRRKPDQR